MSTFKYVGADRIGKCRCYFCGDTRSVKYMMDIYDPVISNKMTSVCICNKCAARYANVCLGIPET